MLYFFYCCLPTWRFSPGPSGLTPLNRRPTNEAYAKLPRLKLVNELARERRPTFVGHGNARKTALEVAPQTPRRRPVACRSVLSTISHSAIRGASQLREKGLTPRQRVEKGEISKGFWVYIGGLKTDTDVAEVLRTLEQSHVEDAHVMPDTGDVHQVSVGLFSERDRADRRAESVQKLGLQPEVAERKLPATLFWMDVDLPPGTAARPRRTWWPRAAAPPASEVVPCPTLAPPPDTAPGAGYHGALPYQGGGRRTRVEGALIRAARYNGPFVAGIAQW